MTKQAMALVVFMAGSAASAGQAQQKLTVYVRNTAMVPATALIPAEGLAARMFAEIGVSLEWRNGKPAFESSRPIFVELTTDTPERLKPGALAYALPYEGSHLRVFYDRIASNFYPRSMLAHVLVHEITHLLQGVSRHSATGVMKAHWTNDDFRQMSIGTLPFTPGDVQLIYAGLGAGLGAGLAARANIVTPATR
jgi:hypothetical protein